MRVLLLWLPAIAWAAAILFSSTDAFSAGQSNEWLAWLFGPEIPPWVNFVFRKSGHVFAYGILGILLWRAEKRPLVALSLALLVASLDEYRQSTAAERTGTVWDVALDISAAAVAVLVLAKWRRARQPDRPRSA